VAQLYRPGQMVSLMITFCDPLGRPIDPTQATVSIWHMGGVENRLMLSEQSLARLQTGIYYYKWRLPTGAPLGEYNAVYTGVVDGEVGHTVESFTVINLDITDGSDIGTAEVHGVVTDSVGVPIGDVTIIAQDEENHGQYSTLTENDGTWELHLLPGRYAVLFYKRGYIRYENQIQVPDVVGPVPFESIIV
jgi:hypothetical protein